jgi:hypothetical protein
MVAKLIPSSLIGDVGGVLVISDCIKHHMHEQFGMVSSLGGCCMVWKCGDIDVVVVV